MNNIIKNITYTNYNNHDHIAIVHYASTAKCVIPITNLDRMNVDDISALLKNINRYDYYVYTYNDIVNNIHNKNFVDDMENLQFLNEYKHIYTYNFISE